MAAVARRVDLAAAAKLAKRRDVRVRRDDYFEVGTKKSYFSCNSSCVAVLAESAAAAVVVAEAHLAAKVLRRAFSSRVSCDDPCGQNGGYRRSTGTHGCPCEQRRDA